MKIHTDVVGRYTKSLQIISEGLKQATNSLEQRINNTDLQLHYITAL